MRKLAIIAMLALAGVLSLTACGKKGGEAQNQTQQTAQLTRPAPDAGKAAWQAYLGQVLQSGDYMKGMQGDQPYVYYMEAGNSDSAVAERQRQLDGVSNQIAAGVMPGYLIAFAGPSSSATADVITQAFDGAKPGSLNKVIVVFIGDPADEQRVADVVKPTGAIFRFAKM